MFHRLADFSEVDSHAVVDRKKLRALLRRLDGDGSLRGRYEALTGKTP